MGLPIQMTCSRKDCRSLNPSSAELVGDDEYFRKLRKIRETEEAVFDLHPEAIHLRYPQIYGPRQILPREWPIVRRAIDRRPTLIVPTAA